MCLTPPVPRWEKNLDIFKLFETVWSFWKTLQEFNLAPQHQDEEDQDCLQNAKFAQLQKYLRCVLWYLHFPKIEIFTFCNHFLYYQGCLQGTWRIIWLPLINHNGRWMFEANVLLRRVTSAVYFFPFAAQVVSVTSKERGIVEECDDNYDDNIIQIYIWNIRWHSQNKRIQIGICFRRGRRQETGDTPPEKLPKRNDKHWEG